MCEWVKGKVSVFVMLSITIASFVSGQSVPSGELWFQVGVDKDNSTATGCDFFMADGSTAEGIDRLITIRVRTDVSPPMVVGMISSRCNDQTGVFTGPSTLTNESWLVGSNNGLNGSDVVEGYIKKALLGINEEARLVFQSQSARGWDIVDDAVVYRYALPIPTLTQWALIVFLLLMLTAGLWFMRRQKFNRTGLMGMVFIVSLALIAAVGDFMADGDVNDWGTFPPSATDPTGDSNDDSSVDIVGVFLGETEKELFFRFDVDDVENQAPTDLTLDNATVDENQPAATLVGVFTTTDPNPNVFTYSLVSGTGDGDNSRFTISGDQLLTAESFDFETQPTLNIRVQTDDGNGHVFQAPFIITVNDLNDIPTDILLSPSDVDENMPVGTVVGDLSAVDEDLGDTHSFVITPIGGETCDGNAAFTISGNQLLTAMSFDFEAQSSWGVCIETDDGNGGLFAREITVLINDVNEGPTDVTLSNNAVDENEPSGTLVGVFSTSDPNVGQNHTYTLVSGAGDTDNGSFSISGDQLLTAASFNFEVQNTLSIRVRTDDGQARLTFEEVFTITVNDLNDDPSDIGLDNASVDENQPAATLVGTLTSVDEDPGNTHTYSLAAGTGDTDNASFQISGDQLQTAVSLDFETQSAFSVRIQTDDGNGGLFEEVFALTANDLNDDPTAIALDNTSVNENEAAGTAVGNLTATDQDAGDTHTFSLVAGTGDTDNASFQIVGAELQTAASLDFEAQASYSIRIQTDDGNGGLFEDVFTISANDVNDDPTDISLDSNSVPEEQPAGTAVGNLSVSDQDAGDTHTYSLVAGTGDTDNGSFQIVGDQLQTAAVLDFETQETYSIRVQVDDGNGGTFEKVFTINLTNGNDDPTDIALDSTSVDENQAAGAVVGNMSTTDSDVGDTHTYSLVAGVGDTDNGSFTVVGSALQTAAIFDFETKSSYSIRLRTDDGNGGTFDKMFTITVNNLNDDPTDISLDSATLAENQGAGAAVGNLSTTDQDVADTHVYALVAGAGDTDNGAFQIIGSQLQAVANLDFETQNSFSVRIQTDDGNGGMFEKVFAISVTNENDDPTDIALDSTDIDEAQPVGTLVGNLSTTDQDVGDAHTYALVAGAGDTDNGSFQISGSQLQSNAIFDFDVQNSFSIRVQTDDGNGGVFEEVFTISVNSLNDPPTDISLDSMSVLENQPLGTLVGNLSTTDPNVGDTHTYSLVAGTGDTDNGSFQIVGSQLQTNAIFDRETKSSYSVRIQTEDSGAEVFAKAFTITIADVPEAPTANDEAYTVIGNTELVAEDGAKTAANSGFIFTTDSTDLTSNATDIDTAISSLTAAVVTGPTNGDLVIESDGSFTYTPDPGYTGADSFTYNLSDGDNNSNTATVNLTIADMVWYVHNDNAVMNPVGGDGRSTDPFDDIDSIESAGVNPGVNDDIFIFQGSGPYDQTNAGQLDGITLENGQRLIGEASDLVVGAVTLHTGIPANKPEIANQFGDVITLANDNTIMGLNLTPTASAGIAGDGADGGTADNVSFTPNGVSDGLSLIDHTTSFTVTNSTFAGTMTASNTGIRIADTVSTTAAITITNSTIGDVGVGLDVQNSDAAIVFNGTSSINQTGGGAAISIFGRDGGSLTFAGTASVTVQNLNAATDAIMIDGTSADYSATFLNVDINASGTGDDAIVLNDIGVGGAINFDGTTTIDTVGGRAVAITGANNQATYGFDSLDITAAAGSAINIEDGTPQVTLSLNDAGDTNGLDNSAGYSVEIANLLNPGSVTFTGGANATINDTGDGILITNCGAGPPPMRGEDGPGRGVLPATIIFNNNVDINSSTNTGVDYNDSTETELTFANLDVVTTNQPGINAAASDNLTITTGTLNTTNGLGIRFNDLLVVNTTFTSVTVNNTVSSANGVDMETMDNASVATFNLVNITTTGGQGFRAVNLGEVTVTDNSSTINTTNETALEVDTASIGAGNLQFASVTSTNSTAEGVDFRNVGGSGNFSAAGMVTNATGTGFNVDGGSGNLTYSGSITNATGQAVVVTNRTGGTVTFETGTIADTGAGGISLTANSSGAPAVNFDGPVNITNSATTAVNINNNTGAVFSFANLNIDNGVSNNTGLFASSTGTVNITTGAIDAGNGRAVDINNTGLGVNLISVDSNGGTAPGIDLNTTTGTFTVAGDGGGNNMSGGVIANKTGANGTSNGVGVFLNNAQGVSLNSLQMNDFQNFAIRGTTVTGFTLTDSTIDGVNGNSAGDDEGSVSFDNLLGSATFTDNVISGGHEDNIVVTNTSGTLNRMTVSGGTIGLNSLANGNDGILCEASGTATLNVTVTGVSFLGSRGDHIQTNAIDTGVMDVIIQDNTFRNAHGNSLGGGVTVSGGSAGGNIGVTYDVSATVPGLQSFEGSISNAITANFLAGAGTISGTIHNNRIGATGVPGSGSTAGGGIAVGSQDQATHSVSIDNNTILGIAGAIGIDVTADGSSAVNASITNNDIDEMSGGSVLACINLVSGSNVGSTAAVCAHVSGNTLDASGGSFPLADIFVDQLSAVSSYNFPGYMGPLTGGVALETFLDGQNTSNGLAILSAAANNITGVGATCP